jgi:hypothetical protein
MVPKPVITTHGEAGVVLFEDGQEVEGVAVVEFVINKRSVGLHVADATSRERGLGRSSPPR